MVENFGAISFYSFYILEENYRDFKKTIQSYIKLTTSDEFISNDQKYMELHIYGGRELGRLIHNYAASWLSLVDHTRAIQKKLKESKAEEIRNFAVEYENKLSESLKDSFENSFVKDLRRYVQHKAVPVPTLHFRMKRVNLSNSESKPPLMDMSYSFEFSTKQIQDFDWSKTSKEYMKKNESIPLEKIIDDHFNMMKDFYLWIKFRDHQLHPYSSSEIKQSTFEEWKQQQNTV
ncbi:hypothetical protein A0J48_001985 [Sphaerospermopsis aphanizomenoides BCCUSP55]|uniref:hypothetical protein n=1 Tax=Sphaerospermopsis aphanizomenoides TaxID=459663 RepID=UPI0019059B22|nr:hypothetical protein [Sphaerospermopsis aphanizomenoides]MBK1986331.1 hypothetical protein [Sphaerospermopsis aphanizomenoides BCCUSP55]